MDRKEIIKQLNNLGVEIIAAYLGIRGKTTGLKFVGHCPFHEDEHPSFNIYEGKDGNLRAKCHANCFDGNMIDLFMKMWFGSTNESYFLDTIKRLQIEGLISGDNYKKNRASYKPQIQAKIPQPIENTVQTKKVDPGAFKGLSKEDMFKIWDYCGKIAYNSFKDFTKRKNPCDEYLQKRGIGKSSELAGLRYWSGNLPESILFHNLKKHKDDDNKSCSLYPFSGKQGVLIPFWHNSEIIGLQLRQFIYNEEQKPYKYLFPKGQGSGQLVWHLDGFEGKSDFFNYEKGQPVLICEGVIDALSAIETYQDKYFVIACPSASMYKGIERAIPYIIEKNIKKVIISGDNDEPGKKFNKDVGTILRNGYYQEAIEFTDLNCNDINDYIKGGAK